MSYSFYVRAASMDEVGQLIKAKLDEVAAQQELHQNDRHEAETVAKTFLSLLPDDPSQDIIVSMNGSIGSIDGKIVSAGVGVSVSHAPRA